MKKTITSLLIVGGFAAASHLQAQTTLADWTFETSQPTTAGPFTPEIEDPSQVGVAAALGSHASGSTVYSTPSGNGSTHSFSANVWTVGDYYQVEVTTVGFQNIQLSYNQTSSSTGPGKFLLEYSLNGTTFTPVTGTDYTILVNGSPNVAWNTATVNPAFTYTDSLSSIAALDNAATVYIRFADDSTTPAGTGASVATAGTDRMDNIIITASAIPEPTALALLGMGGLASMGFFGRRRK